MSVSSVSWWWSWALIDPDFPSSCFICWGRVVRVHNYHCCFLKDLFTVFGCAGPSSLHGLFDPVAERGLICSCGAAGFSLRRLLSCCGAQALRAYGLLCSCGSGHNWFPGSRARVQWLRHMGFVAPKRMGSCEPEIEPVSPALAGRILHGWATRETHGHDLLWCVFFSFSSIKSCFLCLSALFTGTDTFTDAMCSWWIDPFIIASCDSGV